VVDTTAAALPAFEPLGAPTPAALAGARVELHFAAQLPAAVGRALVAPAPDDSHTSLEWLAGPRLLAGVRAPSGLRAALRPADLALAVLGDADAPAAELPLAGRTFAEAAAWLAAALRAPAGTVLGLPPYDMPAHPIAGGARFGGEDRAAAAELARWYATADATLRALARSSPGASAVRSWPHHFDIATLLPGPAVDTTIGVGLSPGDGSYAEPYFYVTPWPYPKDPAPPELPGGGHWHREGWFGAVLTATSLLAAPRHASAVEAFVEAAVAACAGLLRADPSP
jgi:hypothetical protein